MSESESPKCDTVQEPKELDQSPAPPPPPMMEPLGAVQSKLPTWKEGDRYKRGNCSSRVPVGQMEEFVDHLVAKKLLGYPLFSVSDCNCFHTSGYLWGRYAFKHAFRLRKGPVAVVNIDQHADRGYSGPLVMSDGWGVPLLLAVAADEQPACYVSTPNAGDTQALAFRGVRAPQGPKPELGSFSTQDWTSFWKDVKRYFGGQAVRHVFVSIDLDCVTDNYTQWGDSGCELHSTAGILNALDKVLDPLFGGGARLIGFDVTGLPEHPYRVRGLSDTPPSPGVVWRKIDDRILKLQRWATRRWRSVDFVLMRKQGVNSAVSRQPFGKVVFYSGSIGYTKALWDDVRMSWDHEDFVGCVARGLPRLLSSEDWKYLLCRQAAPVFLAAEKKFRLFDPEKPIPELLGWKYGDHMELSPTDFRRAQLKLTELHEQLAVGSELGNGVAGELGKAQTPHPPSFECSASIRSLSSWKGTLAELAVVNSELKKRIYEHVYVTSGKGPMMLLDKESESECSVSQ